MQFTDGITSIGSPVTVANGFGSMTTTLAPGTHLLTAVFTPTNPVAFNSSTSNTVTFVINPPPTPTPTTGVADTTTTLLTAPNPGFAFCPEILMARVSPFHTAGTVQFSDGNTPIGGPVPVTGGFAFTLRSLPPGTHSLIAVFSPTNGFASSTSAAVLLTIKSLF